jgi:hypothetical protein
VGRREHGIEKRRRWSVMAREPTRAETDDLRMIERAIVLQVLRDDHRELWSRLELAREVVGECRPEIIERALERLERDGVLRSVGAGIGASRAVRCLDELELIGL